MKRWILGALLVVGTTGVIAFQGTPKLQSAAIAPGQITRRIAGNLGPGASALFTVSAKEGQTLVVNATSSTAQFAVVATVTDPKGGMDGGKDKPNFAQKLSLSGPYTIRVSPNLMASNVNQGAFLLEVVVY